VADIYSEDLGLHKYGALSDSAIYMTSLSPLCSLPFVIFLYCTSDEVVLLNDDVILGVSWKFCRRSIPFNLNSQNSLISILHLWYR
jgi:hypothetical protein